MGQVDTDFNTINHTNHRRSMQETNGMLYQNRHLFFFLHNQSNPATGLFTAPDYPPLSQPPLPYFL